MRADRRSQCGHLVRSLCARVKVRVATFCRQVSPSARPQAGSAAAAAPRRATEVFAEPARPVQDRRAGGAEGGSPSAAAAVYATAAGGV